jgi:hypothetical protein
MPAGCAACAQRGPMSRESLGVLPLQPLRKGTAPVFHRQLREPSVNPDLCASNAAECLRTRDRSWRILEYLRALLRSVTRNYALGISHGAPSFQSLKARWSRPCAIVAPRMSHTGLERAPPGTPGRRPHEDRLVRDARTGNRRAACAPTGLWMRLTKAVVICSNTLSLSSNGR